MLTRKNFDGQENPTWCRGCGNFGILNAVKMALAEADIASHQALVVTGIGCGSKLPHYMKVSAFHGLHGRPIPVATGARLANHALRVITVHGDGDGYGEGGAHFISIARRNVRIVDIVQDNRIYGLTKGQYSPTSETGKRTPTSPEGSIDHPINPIALALTAGARFVSRGYAGELKHLAWVIGQALEYPGYALVDVLQPCVTWNRSYSYDFYRDRVYKLEDENGYDPTDMGSAWEKAVEWEDTIPIGVIYRADPIATYEDQVPALAQGPLVAKGIATLDSTQIQTLRNEIR